PQKLSEFLNAWASCKKKDGSGATTTTKPRSHDGTGTRTIPDDRNNRANQIREIRPKQALSRQFLQRPCQNPHAIANMFRGGIFVRTMADPAAAWNENHGRRTYPHHEERIVVGAADHFFDRKSKFVANLSDSLH